MVDTLEKSMKKLFAPIIAYPGWEDAVTDDMQFRIQMERFSTPPSETATAYEAMVYLHTASLATPMSRELTNVYSYLFSKYHTEQAKKIDVYTDKITEAEERELSRLKIWIFQKQMKSK